MSEAISDTSVVSYDAQLRRELAALEATLPPASSNRIRTTGKLFALPSGFTHPGPMHVVVLDYLQINMYYAGPYNPREPDPPVCWAINRTIRDLVPSETAPQRQGASCDTCPKGQWGSAPGGRAKACKNQYRLVLVPADFNATSEPMTLYVSPSGMKHWARYVRQLAEAHAMLPVQVITEIAFDPKEPYPTLLFKLQRPHEQLDLAMRLRAQAQRLLFMAPEAEAPRT